MSPELDQELEFKYPKIFAMRNAKPSETSMCWGFQCDDGWYDLIDTLCSSIQTYIDSSIKRNAWDIEWNQKQENEPRDVTPVVDQIVAVQVKEKFGGLRFYCSGGDSYVSGLVRLAESYSYMICEITGNKGILHIRNGYLKTLSPELVRKDPKLSGFEPFKRRDIK